jgi:hypothetical protein
VRRLHPVGQRQRGGGAMSAERSADRTVHGTGGSVGHMWEIVRYDRSGKWVIEHTGCCHSRRYVSLDVAARTCDKPIPGLPGGRMFDARMAQS